MTSFPSVDPGEPIRISASTFALHERCPESAAARLRGRYGPDSRPGFSGGLAHQIFARHLQGGPIAPEELATACRQAIGGSTLNLKMGALGLKPSGLEQIVGEVGALYERFRKMPADGFAGAEVELEVEPSEDVTLFGSVDAVFEESGGVRLVDWKTGDLGDPLPQLRFYALLWVLDRGIPPRRVEAVSVRTGERLAEAPSEDGLADTAARVASMVTGVRRAWSDRGVLSRNGGPWCRYCPLLDECSEGQATVRLVDPSELA